MQEQPNPLDFLLSSSDDESDILQVRVNDKGSMPQCVKVELQGVPAYGIIDSDADITILGGDLFRDVATVARLKKRDLKKPDKTPKTYDRKPFTLDGRMDLDITFTGKTMCTPVYLKMDAHEQLLLSEGVCRQLGIIQYHKSVEKWRGGRKQASGRAQGEHAPAQARRGSQVGHINSCIDGQTATVPTVRVSLTRSVHLLPHKCKMVPIQVDPGLDPRDLLLLEPATQEHGAQVDAAVVRPTEGGTAKVTPSYHTCSPCYLEQGATLGEASEAMLVQPGELSVEENTVREDPLIQHLQQRHKDLYNRKASGKVYQLGDWVLVKFPREETGKQRKLSRPWHGPYRVKAKT